MTPNKPWDDKKEMITTALESGISYVLDLDDYDKIQKLGNVKIVANSDDADIYLVGINGEGDGSLILSEDLNQSQDLQEAKKAKREGKTVCAYVEITDKNLIGYVYCDDRVAFVLNIFLERFVNDTVDYHIHYVGVDSLDEECIECRKYSDYCEHILPAFWIDDDFCE